MEISISFLPLQVNPNGTEQKSSTTTTLHIEEYVYLVVNPKGGKKSV